MKKIQLSLKTKKPKKIHQFGFTIIELLVVVVIIGVLVAIVAVSYTRFSKMAVEATLQSDLKNASVKLEADYLKNRAYPTTVADANDGNGLTNSPDTKYEYTAAEGEYCITATSVSNTSASPFRFSSASGLVEQGSCPGHNLTPTKWKQIATYDNTCGITSDDLAYCWGTNFNGELGDNGNSGSYSFVPVAVAMGVKTVKQVSVGDGFACAITSDDLAYCWGYNSYGQLGNGSFDSSSIPVAVNNADVLGGKTFKQIVTGRDFACAIAADDLVYCWGSNNYGQLGDNYNSINYSGVPVAISLSNKTVKQITAGRYHACLITYDNLAYCWGRGYDGQLGYGVGDSSPVPVAVDTTGSLSGKTLKQITASGYHTCGVDLENAAYCWGSNYDGELGDNGVSGEESLVPVAVDMGGKTFKQITAGRYHTCAVDSNNQSYCWGSGGDGQLGDGSLANSYVPIAVDNNGVLSGKTTKQISAGQEYNCAIGSDDMAYCWGSNGDIQLGTNSCIYNSPVPIAVVYVGSIGISADSCGWR